MCCASDYIIFTAVATRLLPARPIHLPEVPEKLIFKAIDYLSPYGASTHRQIRRTLEGAWVASGIEWTPVETVTTTVRVGRPASHPIAVPTARRSVGTRTVATL
jgi:hypothetical protein